MIIRFAKESDLEQINMLAAKHKILFPDDGLAVVAVDETNKVIGVYNLRNVVMIEPFICENPLTSVKLMDHAMKVMQENNIKIARGYVDKKILETTKKYGFNEIFPQKHIIEMVMQGLFVKDDYKPNSKIN